MRVMRISSVLPPLLLVIVVAVTANNARTAGPNASAALYENDNMGLIANGEIFKPEQYPFVVCLNIFKLQGRYSICTGSLISPMFVLTAAHCTNKKLPQNIKVYRVVSLDKKRSSRSVVQIYQHPKFNNKTLHADISLLKLNKPFRNVGHYAVLSGSPSDFDNDAALNCTIIGFGLTEDENAVGGANGYVTTTIVKFGPKACEASNTTIISSTWNEYLCSKPDRHMVCPGDSGGPMMCDGYQYGVASHAFNFKNLKESANVVCGSPDIQTRHLFVYAHKGWIKRMQRSGSAASVVARRGSTYDAILTVSVCAVYVGSKNALVHVVCGVCTLIVGIITRISTCVRY